MTKFKFSILFLYKLIITNPCKLIFIFLSCFFWVKAGTYPDVKSTLPVVDSLKSDGNFLYVYKTIKNDKINYDIWESNVPVKLVNSAIIYDDYNDKNVLCWAGFACCLIITIVILSISISNSDIAWNFSKSFNWALSWFVKADMVDDYYIQYVFGKMVSKQMHLNSVEYLNINNLRNLRSLPDYESVNEKRDRTLKKIGINYSL